MKTGDQALLLHNKQALGLAEFRDFFFSLLEQWTGDVAQAMWDEDGWYSADSPALSSSGEGLVTVEAGKSGTDGVGNLIETGQTESYDIDVPFPNANAVVYDVGLVEAKHPVADGLKTHDETGVPAWDYEKAVVGRLAEPTSVVDNGDDTMTIDITSLLESGHDHTGRTVFVWMKSPASSVPSVAFQSLTSAYNVPGTYNYVICPDLGQTVISTTASDYQVLVVGPWITSVTDLTVEPGVLFCGKITGTGAAGGPVTVFDYSDVLQFFDWPDLWNVIEVGPNGDLKIRVRQHGADLSDDRQISTYDPAADKYRFIVGKDGRVRFLRGADKVVFEIDPSNIFMGSRHYASENKAWTFEQDGGDNLYLMGRDKSETVTVSWNAEAQQLFMYRADGTTAAILNHSGTTALEIYDAASALVASLSNTSLTAWSGTEKFRLTFATGNIDESGGLFKSTFSKITFSDQNTTADVDLTEDGSPVWTALPTTGPQDASMLGVLNGAATEKMISPILVEGAEPTDGGGLNLTIASGTHIFWGQKWSVPETNVVLPDASTSYVYFNFTTESFDVVSAASFTQDGVDRVWLAKAVTAAGSISSIDDLRRPYARLDRKASSYEILVGEPGHSAATAWTGLVSMFSTLGEALDVINVYTADSAQPERYQWTIKIIGNTTETAPLAMPLDGIKVVGVPSGGETGGNHEATITWSNAQPLFDLNGKEDLDFSGVRAEYTGSYTTGTDPVVAMFADLSTPGAAVIINGLRIRGCRLTKGDAFLIFDEQTYTTMRDVYIEENDAEFLGTAGIIARFRQGTVWSNTSNSLHIRKNRFQTVAAGQATNDRTGIVVSTDMAHIIDNVLTGFTNQGIRVHGSTRTPVVRGNTIEPSSQTTAVGIQVDNTASAIIRDNYIDGATTYGISIAGDHTVVVGNTFDTCAVGVYCTGSYSQIKDNRVESCTSYGVQVWNSTTEGVDVIDNRILSPANHAVYIGGAVTAALSTVVRGNKIDTCDEYGIYVEKTANYTRVQANRINDTDRSAIYVTDSDYVRICDNDITDACTDDSSGDAGIQWAGASAHGRTERNNITLKSGLTNIDQAIYYDSGDVHFCKNNDCLNGKIEQVGPTGPDDFIIAENMVADDIVVNGDDIIVIGNRLFNKNISLANGIHHAVVGNHTGGGNIALQNAATQYAEVVGNHLRSGGAVTGAHANDDVAHNMP